MSDVRAVHRGHNSGGSNTERYFIIIEFERNRNATVDEESFSSSDAEFQYLKEQQRLQDEANTDYAPSENQTDHTEAIVNIKDSLVEEEEEVKDPYRRGIHKGGKGVMDNLYS